MNNVYIAARVAMDVQSNTHTTPILNLRTNTKGQSAVATTMLANYENRSCACIMYEL